MIDDLRFAWRRLRHSPGFAAVAILTLAVGVGANTAILSVADAVLFRPLPYSDPDRVFLIQMLGLQTGEHYTRVDYDIVRAIEDRHSGLGPIGRLESLGPTSVTLETPSGPQPVASARVSADYFAVLGVRPAHGRLFTAADLAAGTRTAMLSHASWQQRFGGNPSVVGRPLRLRNAQLQIVGVLPPDFMFPTLLGFVGRPEIITVAAPRGAATTGGTIHPVVRLEPGVTREQAQAELDVLAAQLAAGATPDAVPYLDDIRETIYPTGRPIMRYMLAAAMLLLLLGCANLANLLLARSRRRERETAMRAALGASRLRIVRPVVVEALMVGVAGSVLAVLVASVTFDALLAQVPDVVYGNAAIGVDGRVIRFGMALGVASALLFAVLPALRIAGLDAQDVIQGRSRAAGPGGARAARPLVALQVALALVLVFGAVIATRAFVDVLGAPLGFNPESVVLMAPPQAQESEDRLAVYRRAIDALAGQQEVVVAGGIGSPPLGRFAPWSGALRPGSDAEWVAGVVHALPGFFEATAIPLVRGRLLTWADAADRSSAVVSERAARALFGEANALGQSFKDTAGDAYRVVGVVGDVRRSFDRDDPPTAYVIPGDRGYLQLVARTRATSAAALASIKEALAPLYAGRAPEPRWWSDDIAGLTAYRNPRFQTIVLASFAIIALSLTALGIFSVVALTVATRAKEMGIRVALGARPGSLVSLMVREAMTPVLAGLALGLLATRWLSALAEAQLYQVDANDPATLAMASVAALSAGLVAAYLPARRTSRIDPARVLKSN